MNGQWRRSPLLAVGSSCRFALLLTRNRRLRHVSGCETGDQLFLEHTVAQRCTAVASTAFWQHTFIAQGVQEVKLSFFVPEWRKITDFSFFTKNICFSEFRCFNTFQWRFEALALYVSTGGGGYNSQFEEHWYSSCFYISSVPPSVGNTSLDVQ